MAAIWILIATEKAVCGLTLFLDEVYDMTCRTLRQRLALDRLQSEAAASDLRQLVISRKTPRLARVRAT